MTQRVGSATAIINGFGRLSELHLYRAHAETAVLRRGDHDECSLQRVMVIADGPAISCRPPEPKPKSVPRSRNRA